MTGGYQESSNDDGKQTQQEKLNRIELSVGIIYDAYIAHDNISLECCHTFSINYHKGRNLTKRST